MWSVNYNFSNYQDLDENFTANFHTSFEISLSKNFQYENSSIRYFQDFPKLCNFISKQTQHHCSIINSKKHLAVKVKKPLKYCLNDLSLSMFNVITNVTLIKENWVFLLATKFMQTPTFKSLEIQVLFTFRYGYFDRMTLLICVMLIFLVYIHLLKLTGSKYFLQNGVSNEEIML